MIEVRQCFITLQVAVVSIGLGRLPCAFKQAGVVDTSVHGRFVPHRQTPPEHILSIGGERSRNPPQASAVPHLHTPATQVSEFPWQGALVPHLQTPLMQLPDAPQSIPRQGSEIFALMLGLEIFHFTYMFSQMWK